MDKGSKTQREFSELTDRERFCLKLLRALSERELELYEQELNKPDSGEGDNNDD
jgi:hypothetical protein